jgi:hypothetical protein
MQHGYQPSMSIMTVLVHTSRLAESDFELKVERFWICRDLPAGNTFTSTRPKEDV